MPSREYVEQMLTTGNSNEEEVVDEVAEDNLGHDEEVSEVADEATVEDEVATEEESVEEEEGPEDEGEEAPEEEEEQAEQEDLPEAAHEDEFYLAGRYKSRDEAEKGWLEKEQHISRLAEQIHQQNERMAQYEGYLAAMQQQPTSAPGEFEAWAESYFEAGQGELGAQELVQTYQQTGDEDYLGAIDVYLEMWKEHDPYEAGRVRNSLDTAAALNQFQQMQTTQQAPSVQDVINESWVEVAQTDPELKDEEFARGVGQILINTPVLRAGALSGDPEKIKSAIAVARDGYRMQAARPGNGTPRKVKSSDAEKLRKDKLDASVTTGDSAPERGRASTPEVPPELQEMMQRIQGGEGGFPKLKDF